nr:unnamed protein product [Haemonchus contortus]
MNSSAASALRIALFVCATVAIISSAPSRQKRAFDTFAGSFSGFDKRAFDSLVSFFFLLNAFGNLLKPMIFPLLLG